MKNKIKKASILCVIICVGASCASPGKRTAIGAGGGAAAGAAIGGLTGGWKGAAIGAAAGGLLGGSVGNYLDKQAQELEQVAETQRTKEGIMVKLKNDLLFDTGRSVLKDQGVQNVSELGQILAKYPEDRIRIEGFTDNTGKAASNDELSTRRASAVKNILLGQGVKESQMSVIGYGDSKPAASNTTPSGRAQNRRVELHIDVPNKG